MQGERAGRAREQPALSRFLQAIVEAAREGVVAISPDRRVLAVNRRFCEIWRLPPDSVRIGEQSPALGQAQRSQIVDPGAFEAAIVWGHEHPTETQLLDVALVDGRIIEGYAAPIIDDEGTYLGRVWYMYDDTERRTQERHQAELLDRLSQAQRAQRFLLDASAVLNRTTGFAETLRSLAHIVVPVLADICLVDIVSEQGEIDRIAAVAGDPAVGSAAAGLINYPPNPASEHPTALAIRYGETRWADTMSDELRRAIATDDKHLHVIEELGVNGYMAVPFTVGAQTFGAITLLAGPARRFVVEDVALAEDLAGRVALVAAKELRYDLERSTSHTLQANLLPVDVPRVEGVEIAVRYLPGTRDVEVGGDFWDVTVLPGGEVGLMVGDVAGHDITAAATMAQLRSVCRALQFQARSPGDLIGSIQSVWDQLGLDRVATALFARMVPESGRLQIASAGHLPPLVVEPGKAWFVPVTPVPPLGAPSAPALSWEGQLGPDAVLVCFTDGLVEDRQHGIDEGMERLLAAAAAAPSPDPEQMADHILRSVPGEVRIDDVALMVVRRAGQVARWDGVSPRS